MSVVGSGSGSSPAGMSRSSGEAPCRGASAGTKLGSSTPSGVVPHDQQTSNDESTLAPHFGQVHMPRAPQWRNSQGSDRRRTTRDESEATVSEADHFQEFRRGENVAEVEVAEKRVPRRTLVESHGV